MSAGEGGGNIFLPVIKELNLSISFLLTEPSGYGLYGLFKNFFFQNAVNAVQTTESSNESIINSSGNKRYHFIFLSFHRCEDISGS